MRPSSSIWTVLWMVQMMIQAMEKDFIDPIENTYPNNCVLATVSTEINKQEQVNQGHTPIRYTSNQQISIGNSIKGETRYKIIKGSMCNRMHKLRLKKTRERCWKVHSRNEPRGVNSNNLTVNQVRFNQCSIHQKQCPPNSWLHNWQ